MECVARSADGLIRDLRGRALVWEEAVIAVGMGLTVLFFFRWFVRGLEARRKAGTISEGW
jgi:1-acyl-sn-glycerol-3-phosphate acyltransferase